MGRILQLITRKTDNGNYIPLLDGIRFLAITVVLLQHLSERIFKYHESVEHIPGTLTSDISYALSRGSIGVLLFFTLSGMIISIPFAQQSFSLKKFSYRNYILRRLIRIEPPYFIWMSVCTILLVILNQYDLFELMKHYIVSLFYLHEITYSEFSIINPVAWSLAVEIQFYLIAPLMAINYFKRGVVSRRLTLGLLIILFITFQYIFGWNTIPLKASLLGQIHLFLLGMFIADVYVHSNWMNSSAQSRLWDVVFVISFVVLAITWSEEYIKTFVFIVAMLLFFISSIKGILFNKTLTNRWIAAIGGLCYTIYLIHLPLLEGIVSFGSKFITSVDYSFLLLVYLPICLLMIFAVSVLGYLIVEKPFMVGVHVKRSQVITVFQQLLGISGGFKTSVLRNPKRLIIVLLILFSTQHGLSQELDLNKPITLNAIMPLPEVLALADENTIQLEVFKERQQQLYQEMKLVRKGWLDHLFISSSVNRGQAVISDQLMTYNQNGDTYLTRQNEGFNVGLNLYIPVSKVTNQKNHINIIESKIKEIEFQKEEFLITKHQQIIRLYKELMYQLKTIKLYNDKVSLNETSMLLAENYFNSGRISMEEYRGSVEAYYASQVELEKAKSESFYCLRSIEIIVGRSIVKS